MEQAVFLAIIPVISAFVAGIWTAFYTEKIVPGSRYLEKVEEAKKVTTALELANKELWAVKLELQGEKLRREYEQRDAARRQARVEDASS